MINFQTTTVFLLFTFLWTSQISAECPYQECDCSGPTILCEGKGLNAIPQKVSNSTTGLTNLILAVNSITTVTAGSLPFNLMSVSFASNPITSVDDTAFDGSATTLEMLTFSSALLTRIPDALLHIHTLTSLTIADTNIQDWNENALKQIGLTLTTLYLVNVSLTAWPSWLQHFSHLTELNIGNSSISFIPDGALDMVVNSLNSLSLDGNRFTAVPKALSSLTFLQMLSLQDNLISDVAYLPSASMLLSLTLTSNNISDADQLSNVLQPYSNSLNDIGLDYNMLTTIPDFYFLMQVGILDFSHNLISDPRFGSVPPGVYNLDLGYNIFPSIPALISSLQSVSDLDLPWNSIKEMHGADFSPSITGVDLGHNLITEISAASFPNVSGIITLKLNYNPITKISTDAFSNLHDLTELYLGGTKLTRMPLALASLNSLRVLDITDIKALVCTCMEKSLEPLLRTFSRGDLRGECGHIGVYFFFVTLVPTCSADQIIVG